VKPFDPNRWRERWAVGAIVVLSLPAVVAGCGDTGASVSVASPPSAQELAYQMGVICQNHTDRQVVAIERFEKRHGLNHEHLSARQLETELVRVILPIVRRTIHGIGQLHPPSAERGRFKAFLGALEHGVSASEADPSWIATGALEPFQQARQLSAALGTYYCGQA
jgi:hypothetical protein